MRQLTTVGQAGFYGAGGAETWRPEVREPKSREIHIAGQRYVLKTDADPEYLARLVAYVEERYRELAEAAKGAPPQKVAMLTALRLADELFQERERRDQLKEKVSLRFQKILAIIENKRAKREEK